jgi:hypothetical protein
MDQKQILKQMITFNQTVFNNTFQAMVLLQDQFEQIAQTAVKQADWLPAEGRKAMENWVETCKSSRDNYKRYIDESYEKIEKHFAV